jgi:hypothetical protein
MRRIKLMVVGSPSYLSPLVRRAWDRAGIDLKGPVAAAELAAALSQARLDGAVVDIGYDASTLLTVVELLDMIDVPAVFASTAPDARGGFTFSDDSGQINAIVTQLLGKHQTTLQ